MTSHSETVQGIYEAFGKCGVPAIWNTAKHVAAFQH